MFDVPRPQTLSVGRNRRVWKKQLSKPAICASP
jgi:hypothetical protein